MDEMNLINAIQETERIDHIRPVSTDSSPHNFEQASIVRQFCVLHNQKVIMEALRTILKKHKTDEQRLEDMRKKLATIEKTIKRFGA